MKKILFIASFLCLVSNSFAQNIVHIDSVFEDKTTDLIASKVIILEGATQAEIKMKVKNWAGKNFRDLSKVLVSETENQLVFNYVESYSYTNPMLGKITESQHTRMIIQIKDGKIKVTLNDDGNTYRPGSSGVPATQAHTVFIKDYFKKQGDQIVEKGMAGKIYYQIVTSYKSNVMETLTSIETGILSEQATTALDDF